MPWGFSIPFKADGEEKLLSTYVGGSFRSLCLAMAVRGFSLVDRQPFPMLMDVQVLKSRNPEGGVKIHYSRIQLDEPLKLDFSVPSKYKLLPLRRSIEKNDYESESIIYHEARLDRSIGIVFIYRGLRSEIRRCPSAGAAAQGGVGRYRGDE